MTVENKTVKEYDPEDRSGDITLTIDQMDVISSLTRKQLGAMLTFTQQQLDAMKKVYDHA